MGKTYTSRIFARSRRKYGKPQYLEKSYKKVVEEITAEKTMDTWDLILKELRRQVSFVSYETWIEPYKLIKITENKIVLEVENDFVRAMLEKRHLVIIQKTAEYILKRPMWIELVVSNK